MFRLSPTALCLLNLDISKYEHVTVTLQYIVLPNAQHAAININRHQPVQEHTGMSLPVHIGIVYVQFIMSMHCLCSLVPRLPHSGTQTLKLCRRGEPDSFLSCEKRYRQRGGWETLTVCKHARRLRTEKGANRVGSLLLLLWLSGAEYHTHQDIVEQR